MSRQLLWPFGCKCYCDVFGKINYSNNNNRYILWKLAGGVLNNMWHCPTKLVKHYKILTTLRPLQAQGAHTHTHTHTHKHTHTHTHIHTHTYTHTPTYTHTVL